MALKTNFPTINSWTTQSSLWGGGWVVIAISSKYEQITHSYLLSAKYKADIYKPFPCTLYQLINFGTNN